MQIQLSLIILSLQSVPCAMLIEMARNLHSELVKGKVRLLFVAFTVKSFRLKKFSTSD